MASHFSSKNHFACFIGLVIFCFSYKKFRDNYLNKENRENHESKQENAKILLGYCNRPPNIFCKACKFLVPEMRIDRHFLSVENSFKKRKVIEEQQTVPTASISMNWKTIQV